MNFVDTHCHIQSAGLTVGERSTRELWAKAPELTVDGIVQEARQAGVAQMICVGCDLDDSKLAIETTVKHEGVFASIGLHPHEAQHYADFPDKLAEFAALANSPKVVAIGECGLDFYYSHSPKADQIKVLEFQMQLALDHNLPLIFHVRDAFDDFWPVFGNFTGIRGVLHSFTDNLSNMEHAVSEGLYIGVNGIATFAKQEPQQAMYRSIPDAHLLLETDAPFLTPVPFRGTICKPKHIVHTAEYLAGLRNVDLAKISSVTKENTRKLFNLQEP